VALRFVNGRSASARIAGIVLAAGASRRMGANKLLLMLDGEPLVRRASRRALAAGLEPLVVVLGHESERVQLALADLPCRFAFNAEPSSPMSSSLHRGLEYLPADIDAVVIMLPDMVGVTEHMVRAIASASAETAAPLVVSRYGDVLAPPILFRRPLFAELLASQGEGCGKSVVERHRADALLLDWPPDALVDVDTPEEFARL
jgi:molybdenum cofactor cytidylyltransferase